MQTNNLDVLAQQFSDWRSDKGKSKQIPTQLAESTVALIGEYPKAKIIKTLGINSLTLKNWESQFSTAQRFIELPTSHPRDEITTLRVDFSCGMIQLHAYGTSSEVADFINRLSLGDAT